MKNHAESLWQSLDLEQFRLIAITKAPRWEAVRNRLNRNIDGKSEFSLSVKKGVNYLERVFWGEYDLYKQMNTSEGKEDLDKPV